MSNQISMIEAAYSIVEKSNKPISFNELCERIKEMTGLTDEELTQRKAKLYTNLTLDSRFVNLSSDKWDLSVRYDYKTVHQEVKDLNAEDEENVSDLIDEQLEDKEEDEEETSSEESEEDDNDPFLVDNREGE